MTTLLLEDLYEPDPIAIAALSAAKRWTAGLELSRDDWDALHMESEYKLRELDIASGRYVVPQDAPF